MIGMVSYQMPFFLHPFYKLRILFNLLSKKKKEALTFRSFRPSRRSGVYLISGPSSNVSAACGCFRSFTAISVTDVFRARACMDCSTNRSIPGPAIFSARILPEIRCESILFTRTAVMISTITNIPIPAFLLFIFRFQIPDITILLFSI